jgi:hypothetical protein
MGDQNVRGSERVIVVKDAQEGFVSVVAVMEDFGSSGVVGAVYEGHDIETQVCCCSLMILYIREQLRNV